MALPSGLASQVGYGEETTWGTFATPTRFLEFNDESLALDIQPIKSAGLRAGNRVLRTDRVQLGAKSVAGPITHEVQTKGFSLLLKHCLGQAPTIVTHAGGTISKDHTIAGLGDPTGLGLTIQKGVPDVGGTVRPFSYLGCKVASWTLSNDVNGILMLALTFDGADEDTTQGLAAASYPAGTDLLTYTGGVLNIGGSQQDVRSVSITGTVNLATDRHFIRASRLKKQQLPNALYTIEGELEAEFESMTAYNRFVNKTLAQLDVTWTGPTAIEGAIFPQLKVTLQNVRFTGETPRVGGPDIVPIRLPFEALYDGSTGPITTLYVTTDVAV